MSHDPTVDRIRVAPLIVVRDIAKALTFWRDALGGTVITQWETYAHLTIGQGELHLATSAPEAVDRPGIQLNPPLGVATVAAYVVLHVQDVEQLSIHLASLGWPTLAPPSEPAWGSERRCFLHDPDGHLVELSQTLA